MRCIKKHLEHHNGTQLPTFTFQEFLNIYIITIIISIIMIIINNATMMFVTIITQTTTVNNERQLVK